MPSISIAEALEFLEKKTSNDRFQISYALIRDQGSWRLLNCLINLLGTAEREPVEYVYGDQLVLVREVIQSGLDKRLGEIIISKNFEFEKFSLRETVSLRDEVGHYESDWETAYPGGVGWPYFSIELQLNKRVGRWLWETVVSEKLPVFPGRNAAMNYLAGLEQDNWEHIPGVYAPLQDFRGRIESVQIDGSNVHVKIGSLKLKTSDLILKAFAKSERGIILTDNLEPEPSGHLQFQISEQIDGLALALLEKGSDMPIDTAEWSPQRPSRKFEIKSGTGLESLVTQGESETVEYKVDIDRDDREEFMETISSFANTATGVIVLGVNDRLEVEGFQRNREDIARMIDDGIDSTPPHRIEEANYKGNRLLLVYVEKGKHPPYLSRRTRKAYGRRRGNDYVLSSSEIRSLVLASTHQTQTTA